MSNKNMQPEAKQETKFNLKVFVMSAKDLAEFDPKDLSDPFVKIHMISSVTGKPLGDKFTAQTKVLKKSLNPVWKEEYVFRDVSMHDMPRFEFDVYDARTGTDDFMGRVIIAAENVKHLVESIEKHGSKKDSSIHSSFYYLSERLLPGSTDTEPQEEYLQGELHIVVCSPDLDLNYISKIKPIPAHEHHSDEEKKERKENRDERGSRIRQSKHVNKLLHFQEMNKLRMIRAESQQASQDTCESISTNDITKRMERRQKIREEILTTENSYVRCLQMLMDYFVAPLKTNGVSKVGLTQEQLHLLISNIESIHQFHQLFYLDLTKSASVTVVFLKYVDFFRMYTEFFNGYEKCLATINALRQHKKFQEFMSNVRRSLMNAGGLDLMSYMITPVQRIPRYVLLLRELEKHTDATHPEHNALVEALSKVQNIAIKINEMKRQVENMSKLIEIQNRITGDYTLLQPHRRLIREGGLTTVEQSNLWGSIKSHIRIFFLFNDILLWTTSSYRFKGALELSAAVLSDGKHPLGFEINTSKEHLILVAKDPEERESWLHDLHECTIQMQESRKLARQRKNLQISKAKYASARDTIHDLITKNLEQRTIDENATNQDRDHDDDDDEKNESLPTHSEHAEDESHHIISHHHSRAHTGPEVVAQLATQVAHSPSSSSPTSSTPSLSPSSRTTPTSPRLSPSDNKFVPRLIPSRRRVDKQYL